MRKLIFALAVLALTMQGCKLFERDRDCRYTPTSFGAR